MIPNAAAMTNPLANSPHPLAHLLSKNLKWVFINGFQKEHKELEQSEFINRLKNGTITKEEYGQYLANLHCSMQALEAQISRHPALLSFLSPYFRTGALVHDLQSYPASPSFQQVTLHIEKYEELSEKTPFALAAHAAIQYLAILFGGQVTKKRLQRLWGDAAAISYYEFLAPLSQLRKTLFDALQSLYDGLNQQQQLLFLEEIKLGWIMAGEILDHKLL